VEAIWRVRGFFRREKFRSGNRPAAAAKGEGCEIPSPRPAGRPGRCYGCFMGTECLPFRISALFAVVLIECQWVLIKMFDADRGAGEASVRRPPGVRGRGDGGDSGDR